MTAVTATQARKNLYELVKSTTVGHRSYRIRHRTGDAVLMSAEDYDSLLETLELLHIPGFRAGIRRSVADVQAGRTVSLAEAFGKTA